MQTGYINLNAGSSDYVTVGSTGQYPSYTSAYTAGKRNFIGLENSIYDLTVGQTETVNIKGITKTTVITVAQANVYRGATNFSNITVTHTATIQNFYYNIGGTSGAVFEDCTVNFPNFNFYDNASIITNRYIRCTINATGNATSYSSPNGAITYFEGCTFIGFTSNINNGLGGNLIFRDCSSTATFGIFGYSNSTIKFYNTRFVAVSVTDKIKLYGSSGTSNWYFTDSTLDSLINNGGNTMIVKKCVGTTSVTTTTHTIPKGKYSFSYFSSIINLTAETDFISNTVGSFGGSEKIVIPAGVGHCIIKDNRTGSATGIEDNSGVLTNEKGITKQIQS